MSNLKINPINQIEYREVNNIEMSLGIWNFAENRWVSLPDWIGTPEEREELSDREPIIYRKNLLGAMHPGIKCCIGEVPADKSILKDEKKVKHWVSKMQEGIEVSPTSNKRLYLDITGNSRTHGRGIFTLHRRKISGTFSGGIGDTYFGAGNSMGRINYGSILLTECRKMIEVPEIRIAFVDEELDDGRWRSVTGTGDSHARCSYAFMRALSENVPGIEVNYHRPLQIRIGFPGKTYGILWKGTVLAYPDDVFPIPGKELILPLSGFKANKPKHGKGFTGRIFCGLVHYAENRAAKGSQQLWQWFTPQAIRKDVLPGIHDECILLSQALDNPIKIAQVLADVEKSRLDESFDGNWDETTETDAELEATETDEKYKDPVVEILAADKRGVLLRHPWIVGKVEERLGRRWRRLALNSAVRFRSFMGMPDDDIPDRCFIAKDIPAGWHIFYRNPILHWGSMRLMKSIKPAGGKSDHYAKQDGVVIMNHKTAAEVQGDFDGDFYNVLITPKESRAIADKYANLSDSEYSELVALYWDDKDENFMASLKPYESLLIELNLFELIYDKEPVVDKPSKVKIDGDVEWVMLRSMDNSTGLVSNLIQHARANGTVTYAVTIPNHDMRTGEYTGGEYETTIIAFLAQEMQVAVDRLKNSIFHNEKGIQACRKVVEKSGKPAWLHDRKYKNNRAYIDFSLPTGTFKINPNHKPGSSGDKWIPDNDSPNPMDSVSLMIATVNSYWKEFTMQAQKPSDFNQFFPTLPPQRTYDTEIGDYALLKHIWFGRVMIAAGSIGKNADGSDPEPWKYKDIRKREMSSVMVKARMIREKIEALSTERQQFIDEAKADGEQDIIQQTLKALWEGVPQPNGIRFDENNPVFDGQDRYFPTTPFDWASAFWNAGHSPKSQGKAGFVFNIYQDEIVKRLKSGGDLQILNVWSIKWNPLGDYIFGHPDGKPQSQNPTDEKPTKAWYDESMPHNVYIPSRIDPVTGKLKPRDFMNGSYEDGIIVPHTMQMKISVSGFPNNQENPVRPYHLSVDVRSSNNKTWQRLGFVQGKSTIPEMELLCYAEVYTDKVEWNNLRHKANIPEGTEGKDAKGNLIGPKAFRSYTAQILWRYLDESEI